MGEGFVRGRSEDPGLGRRGWRVARPAVFPGRQMFVLLGTQLSLEMRAERKPVFSELKGGAAFGRLCCCDRGANGGEPRRCAPPCRRGWSQQAQRDVGVCLTPLSQDAAAIRVLEREAAVCFSSRGPWVLPPTALLIHFPAAARPRGQPVMARPLRACRPRGRPRWSSELWASAGQALAMAGV